MRNFQPNIMTNEIILIPAFKTFPINQVTYQSPRRMEFIYIYHNWSDTQKVVHYTTILPLKVKRLRWHYLSRDKWKIDWTFTAGNVLSLLTSCSPIKFLSVIEWPSPLVTFREFDRVSRLAFDTYQRVRGHNRTSLSFLGTYRQFHFCWESVIYHAEQFLTIAFRFLMFW